MCARGKRQNLMYAKRVTFSKLSEIFTESLWRIRTGYLFFAHEIKNANQQIAFLRKLYPYGGACLWRFFSYCFFDGFLRGISNFYQRQLLINELGKRSQFVKIFFGNRLLTSNKNRFPQILHTTICIIYAANCWSIKFLPF